MNKKIFITGASGGIGSAICKKFLDKNFILVLTSSSDNNISKLKEQYGDKHFYYKIDLSNSKNVENCLDEISKNLRCLICQGQSVYDSQSEFALSIKTLIDIKLDNGESEEQIYSYFKEKYGEWIIYDPEFNVKTLLLWLIPLILFAIGGILIFRKLTISKFL